MIGKTNCITSSNSGEIKFSTGSVSTSYGLTIPNPAGLTDSIISVYVTTDPASYSNIYTTIYGDFLSNTVLALSYRGNQISYAYYNISNINITDTNININSPGGLIFKGNYKYTILYK